MAKNHDTVTTTNVAEPDRNEVLLRGKLVTAPEHRTFGSGASLARLLVTVRLKSPSRTDVLPVTVWEPDPEIVRAPRGAYVEVFGQVHRRFWTDAEGRHSRVEVVATTVKIGSLPEAA